MAYAVYYLSATGNTRAVAQAIAAALPEGQTRLEPLGPDADVPGEETLFVGFWTDRGQCPGPVKDFLAKLRGKRVALFGTAGFGVSQAYFDAIIQQAEALVPPGNTLLGSWMCQGKMPLSVRAKYEAMAKERPDDPKIAGFLANFDHALTHPDENDLKNAAAFAKSIAEG